MTDKHKTVHSNDLGDFHSRHDRYGFGTSHHLKGNPEEDGRPGGLLGLGDAGVIISPSDRCCDHHNIGDPREWQFDDLDRTWTAPSIIDGASVGASMTYWKIIESANKLYEVAEPYIVADTFSGSKIGSYVGVGAYGWTTNPGLGCTGFKFTFTGWALTGAGYTLTVPTKPASVAGMKIGFINTTDSGVADDNELFVYVSSELPTTVRDGQLAGIYLANRIEQFITIPANVIPAEGETMYIWIAPGWDANYGGFACNFNWPYNTGEENSGRASVKIETDPIWQTYSSGSSDLGETPEHGDADSGHENNVPWWDGGIPLELVSVPGEAVDYGMTGGYLYLTADAPTYLTVKYSEYEGEQEGEDGEDYNDESTDLASPWSREFWTMRDSFEMDVVGSLTTAGTREILWEVSSDTVHVKAYAYLGDAEERTGIGIDTGDGVTRFDFDFSADVKYGVRVDCRNGVTARMRVWDIDAGDEPARWDIEIPLVETAADDDYFLITISAGNGAAEADQTVKLYGSWWAGSVDGGYWVDQWLGVGDGWNVDFLTPQRYVPNSLAVRVDGFWVSPAETDPYRTQYQMDNEPAADAYMRARYLVDKAIDEADEDDTEEDPR